MLSAISDTEQNGAQQKRLITRGHQISEELPTLTPDVVRSILMTLVNRVDVKREHVEMRIYRQQLHNLLRAQSTDSLAPPQTTCGKPDDILKFQVKARLRRVGREMKLVVHNADDRAAADPGLLRIIARARITSKSV